MTTHRVSIGAMHVEETSAGYVVVGTATPVAYSTRDEALSACVTRTLTGLFQSSTGPIGEWRWIDSSSECALSEGRKIDLTTLQEAADSLNGSPIPIPIDGATGSVVHGTSATGGGVPANGWGHAAALLKRADGTWHLMLRAELLPDVAADMDVGRWAFGSIDFAYDIAKTADADGALRGVTWESHAITNKPANKDLQPSSIRASAQVTTRIHMTTKLKRVEQKAAAQAAVADTEMAAPPPADAGAETPEDAAAEADLATQVADLQKQVASLSAQVEALMSENMAMAAQIPDAAQLAASAVDDAIKTGRILATARDKWIEVARLDLPRFRELAATMRAVPGRQAERKEVSPAASGQLLSGEDVSHIVKTMRSAGVSQDAINKELERRGVRQHQEA